MRMSLRPPRTVLPHVQVHTISSRFLQRHHTQSLACPFPVSPRPLTAARIPARLGADQLSTRLHRARPDRHLRSVNTASEPHPADRSSIGQRMRPAVRDVLTGPNMVLQTAPAPLSILRALRRQAAARGLIRRPDGEEHQDWTPRR